MNIIYAVPSYQRPKLLKNTTLKLLVHAEVEEIDLYINEDELATYQEELSDVSIQINYKTINFNGIGKIRNHIRSNYPTGTNLLMIDDDIEEILIQKNNKLFPLENIKEFNESMFIEAEEIGAYYWSVQLHNNPYFMKKELIKGLTYCNGSWTGVRIDNSLPKIVTNINHFEDYLFSILHFIRDRNVLKAGNVCLKTKCFNPKGGICHQLGGFDKRQTEAFKNSIMLNGYFNKLLNIKHSVKYDVANIRLKNVNWRPEYQQLSDNYYKNNNLSYYNV
tara:strand:- start:5347 stop:6177 length:831 start_codon:yes stop_codon:yes gene_type:complete